MTDPGRFDLPALQGGARVRLADFRGKPLVVNMTNLREKLAKLYGIH